MKAYPGVSVWNTTDMWYPVISIECRHAYFACDCWKMYINSLNEYKCQNNLLFLKKRMLYKLIYILNKHESHNVFLAILSYWSRDLSYRIPVPIGQSSGVHMTTTIRHWSVMVRSMLRHIELCFSALATQRIANHHYITILFSLSY